MILLNNLIPHGIRSLVNVEECGSPNNHKSSNQMKAITDSNTKKVWNKKNHPQYYGECYMQIVFVTNEDWTQYCASGERRHLVNIERRMMDILKKCVRKKIGIVPSTLIILIQLILVLGLIIYISQ